MNKKTSNDQKQSQKTTENTLDRMFPMGRSSLWICGTPDVKAAKQKTAPTTDEEKTGMERHRDFVQS